MISTDLSTFSDQLLMLGLIFAGGFLAGIGLVLALGGIALRVVGQVAAEESRELARVAARLEASTGNQAAPGAPFDVLAPIAPGASWPAAPEGGIGGLQDSLPGITSSGDPPPIPASIRRRPCRLCRLFRDIFRARAPR